jgi:hypothetical protein
VGGIEEISITIHRLTSFHGMYQKRIFLVAEPSSTLALS